MNRWSSKKWVIAILAVLLAVGAILGMCRFARHVPSQPQDEVFVGDTVILLDGERLTALDAATGAQLAVDVLNYTECWAGKRYLWCHDKRDDTVVLDPRTLVKVPAPGDDFDLDAKLADDRNGMCGTVKRIPYGAGTLILSYDTPSRLTSDPPPPAESETPGRGGPALTFLEGDFLVASPTVPIVLFRHSGDGPELVTRVDSISHAVWEQGIAGTCRHARVIGDLLIVVTSNPKNRAFAIDINTGARRWSFGR